MKIERKRFLVCVGAGLVVSLALQVVGLAGPLRRMVQALAAPAQTVLADALTLGPNGPWSHARYESVMRDLQRENARLRDALRSQQILGRENDFLKQRLRYVSRHHRALLYCRVLRRDSLTTWYGRLQIDRGSADGMRPGMALVTEEGLAGRILSVSRHQSEVLLVTDPASRVLCRLPGSGALGVIHGPENGAGPDLQLVCAPDLSPGYGAAGGGQPAPGDAVFTCALNGQVPDGIFIGNVLALGPMTDGAGQVATVRLAAAPRPRDYLFVVLDTPAPLLSRN